MFARQDLEMVFFTAAKKNRVASAIHLLNVEPAMPPADFHVFRGDVGVPRSCPAISPAAQDEYLVLWQAVPPTMTGLGTLCDQVSHGFSLTEGERGQMLHDCMVEL